jgi:hypothetical protein
MTGVGMGIAAHVWNDNHHRHYDSTDLLSPGLRVKPAVTT